MLHWEAAIPTDLHSDFRRQVEEVVSAELMQILRNTSDDSEIDDDEMERQLYERFTQEYIDNFKNGRWPPKASAQLGIKAGHSIEACYWICNSCHEKNSNSFTTCRKCNEDRPAVYIEKAESRSSVHPRTSQALLNGCWSCKGCVYPSNPLTATVCAKCNKNQDVYKQDTWPPPEIYPDPNRRSDLRKQLFNRIRIEFDIDDPFSSIDISHEEFFSTISRLKHKIIDENLT